jgi:V/A-type H+-transporting ATPase subunit D
MSRLNLPPTKSTQLRLKHDLGVAEEGFRLLDQKREILVLELMRMLDKVRRLQESLDSCKKDAYETLKQATARNGFHLMEKLADGIQYQHRVELQTRIVAGVRLPVVEVEKTEYRMQYSVLDSDSLVDKTSRLYLKLLGANGEMAEVQSSVWLLARELKKTQRRVNALEQIFIPDFSDTLNYVSETLESKELEAFSILKLLKRNLERKNESEMAAQT